MADYSEFPTTPTGWQEIDQVAGLAGPSPAGPEDVAPPKRGSTWSR